MNETVNTLARHWHKRAEYWQQQAELIAKERDDITRLCAELEKKNHSALIAIKQVILEMRIGGTITGATYEKIKGTITGIEEPTDA